MRARIWELAPPHKTRLIGCAGGLGEFWGWESAGINEIVNDADKSIYNLYSVWRSEKLMKEFLRQVQAIPFGRDSFEDAKRYCEAVPIICIPSVEWAVHTFVKIRTSLMGMGKSLAPVSKTRTRSGMNEQVSAWLGAVDGLPEAHERLKRVFVENLPVEKFLSKYDGDDVFAYVDPPYHPDTREPGLYAVEMTHEQHVLLLDCALGLRAKVMISGYDCELYAQKLAGWTRREFQMANAMGVEGEKQKRVEVIWCNY